MKIIDKNGLVIESPDLKLGYLIPDKLFVQHHEAIPEVEEQSHLEEAARYANGGIDYIRIIDVPYSPAKEAWDEYEEVTRYILYTPEQLEEMNKPEPSPIDPVWDEMANAIRKGVNTI